jgi:hypothetical protein
MAKRGTPKPAAGNLNLFFFSNLGDENATALSKDTGAREAVLLSPSAVARRAREAAIAIKARGTPMAADNGNTTVIFKIASEFLTRAAGLKAERLKAERGKPGLLAAPAPALDDSEQFQERGAEAAQLFQKQLAKLLAAGKSRSLAAKAERARPPEDLRAAYRQLAEDVAKRCGDFVTAEHQQEILAAQASVRPDFFTCLEDLSIPIMVQLDLEPEYTGQPDSAFVKLQQRGLGTASNILKKKFGPFVGLPYATIHGFDYDTAFQVGVKAAGIEGLEAIGTGLASFMSDNNYTKSYRLQGRRVDLKSNVPRRYLRALLVTLGLLDGFASKRGVLPRFHGLGAGSPILLPLLALCGYGSPYFSLDSTAPEKNASMGKIAFNRPCPSMLGVEELAQTLVEREQTWDCPCPYCAALQSQLPFRLDEARKYYKAAIAPKKIERRHLVTDDGIGQFLSLCWETRTQPAKKLIYQTRVNHSQWAMTEIVRELRGHSSSYGELRKLVGEQCETYKTTVPRPLSLQIDECLKIIDQLRPFQPSRRRRA